ncbi:MAG TPA: carboxypeptidase-like regulatory domain-containing protein [Solirubrobacterales bacterium]|jgi:hypothetical protein|nr:carboxypeptidase-like regulatory domain-containing protein [Solirubrobacterales bacterium]
MKRSLVSKSLLVSVACAAALVLPSAALASSISGTVTAPGGGGIQGVEVCPTPQPYTFETICVETGPSGQYKYDGLPGGNYIVRFSAERENLKYVSEFYNDKPYSYEADLFDLGPAEDKPLDVELAEGGSIGGTVTDEGGQPIADIRACAIDPEGIPTRCANTGTNGEYQLNGLPTGEYDVEYEGGNRVNYLSEFYEDAETSAEATDVTVTAPALTPDINAKLAPGAQILGHVSAVDTGTPLADEMVCVEEQPPGEYEACDWTDSAGNYAIRSIPSGTYVVAFGVEFLPFGRTAGQWWQGASTRAGAAPITIAPPETRAGIDGQLPPKYQPPRPEPLQVTLLPAPPAPKPLRCKKGFRKKFVKGKQRCVKIHKKHLRHSHKHGPHAVATGR